ncbi:hypothetical protein [Micromonospora sp. U21]|uniref:hypothetical protein n=1 Tax=Micromonospora sp. U21 TaxID=2824899 RepID=UPI001B36ED4B|nr:hypothetical protein [Micromonospora sp. U21]
MARRRQYRHRRSAVSARDGSGAFVTDADELHASATLLGTYYMAFGAGALVGGLTVG